MLPNPCLWGCPDASRFKSDTAFASVMVIILTCHVQYLGAPSLLSLRVEMRIKMQGKCQGNEWCPALLRRWHLTDKSEPLTAAINLSALTFYAVKQIAMS